MYPACTEGILNIAPQAPSDTDMDTEHEGQSGHMYWQEVMRYNVHSMLHCQSSVAQTACRLLSLCKESACCDLCTNCMPHVVFVFPPCLSHVHIACCRPHATCCVFARSALWTVCQILPPTLSSFRIYVVSCVQSFQ
jgi:hypothetical protein